MSDTQLSQLGDADAELSGEPSASLFAALLLLLTQVAITMFQYQNSHNGLGVVRKFENLFVTEGIPLAEDTVVFALLLHLVRAFVGLNFLSNDSSFKSVLVQTQKDCPGKLRIEWFLRVFFIVDQGLYLWALRSDYTSVFLLLIAAQSAGLILYQFLFFRELYMKDVERKTNWFLLVGDFFFIFYTITLVCSWLANPTWPSVFMMFSVVAYLIIFVIEIFFVYKESLRKEGRRIMAFFFG
jgi:hypothetical protein